MTNHGKNERNGKNDNALQGDGGTNIAICLIHQTNYLIDQQVRRLEQEFLEQGGLRKRMTRARIAYRNGK